MKNKIYNHNIFRKGVKYLFYRREYEFKGTDKIFPQLSSKISLTRNDGCYAEGTLYSLLALLNSESSDCRVIYEPKLTKYNCNKSKIIRRADAI